MSKLKNKVAVVTGASKGIGAGIAKALAAEGASVVVNYASSKEGADRVVAGLRKTAAKRRPFRLMSPKRLMCNAFSRKRSGPLEEWTCW
jgi:NAD(P)-dependent dehydrogenase (short-subunit alcohol dehydrogenase family)